MKQGSKGGRPRAESIGSLVAYGQPSGSDATCLLALVWSLARMLANVVRQVVLARKRLRAVLTAVRRLSRMRPDVYHQVLLPGEGLAAPRLPSVQRKASLTRQPSTFPLYSS